MVCLPNVSWFRVHERSLASRSTLPNLLARLFRFLGIMSAEGNFRSFYEAVEGEPLVLDYMTMMQGSILPKSIRYLIGALMGPRLKLLMDSTRK
jgi:hypothetical protein